MVTQVGVVEGVPAEEHPGVACYPLTAQQCKVLRLQPLVHLATHSLHQCPPSAVLREAKHQHLIPTCINITQLLYHTPPDKKYHNHN
jgi:hypothetical protein